MANKNTPQKRLRQGHRRCNQTQCSFYLQGGCKSCSECNARPFEINESCNRCLDCENVPNALRWDDKKLTENVELSAEKEKAILEVVKAIAEQELKKLSRKQKEQPIVVER
jgi:hypothetical protein